MMRRLIAAVAVAVMLGTGCQAEAGCCLRIVNYNVAKLNSENPDNPNCVPGSLSTTKLRLRQVWLRRYELQSSSCKGLWPG